MLTVQQQMYQVMCFIFNFLLFHSWHYTIKQENKPLYFDIFLFLFYFLVLLKPNQFTIALESHSMDENSGISIALKACEFDYTTKLYRCACVCVCAHMCVYVC